MIRSYSKSPFHVLYGTRFIWRYHSNNWSAIMPKRTHLYVLILMRVWCGSTSLKRISIVSETNQYILLHGLRVHTIHFHEWSKYPERASAVSEWYLLREWKCIVCTSKPCNKMFITCTNYPLITRLLTDDLRNIHYFHCSAVKKIRMREGKLISSLSDYVSFCDSKSRFHLFWTGVGLFW